MISRGPTAGPDAKETVIRLNTPEVLIEPLRARERRALSDLAAVAGGRSLCSMSREGAAVPAAKYYEGAAAALAEARRAVEEAVDGPAGAQATRAAFLGVRARWRTQSHTMGRKGLDWTGYLTGGLDALEQMIGDGGLDAFDTQH